MSVCMNLRVRTRVKWAQLIELSAFAPRLRGVYKFFFFFTSEASLTFVDLLPVT